MGEVTVQSHNVGLASYPLTGLMGKNMTNSWWDAKPMHENLIRHDTEGIIYIGIAGLMGKNVVDLGWIPGSPVPGYRLGSRESVRLGRFH